MDVHKPKPFHGWREFLKEYGIIVIGVLTALAAEQGAGALRERRQAAEARENIRGELANDLASLGNREATEACIERRLGEVASVMQASQRPGYARPSWVGRPQFWPIFEANWHAATNAGRASLMSAQEQARYGQLYFSLELLQASESQEQVAWAHLRTLEAAQPVPSELASALQLALAEARLTDWQIRLYTVRSRDLARGMNLPMVPPQHRGSISICLPMNTPRDEAIERVRAGSGDNLGEP